jgi:FAD/FMN-containing dehydrogenase
MAQGRSWTGRDAPTRIRTWDLLLRRESLYPTELSGPSASLGRIWSRPMATPGDEPPRPSLLSRRQVVRGSGLVAAGAAVAPGAVARALAAVPPDRSLARLETELDGALLRPGDPEFLPAALQTAWRFAVSPSAIAVCANADDASRAVMWARETGTPFAVRGGGHSYNGASTTPGLLISTRGMRDVTVDRNAGTVRMGAGALAGEMLTALKPHSALIPLGLCPMVGVAGLTLGGGWGAFAPAHGLTCDSLVAAEVVTADGKIITCSDAENRDLFWALRGAGQANFGVVTELTYKSFAAPRSVSACALAWLPDDLEAFVGTAQRFAARAPDGLGGELAFEPALSARTGGRMPMIARFFAIYQGPSSELQQVIEPLLKAAPPFDMSIQDSSVWDAFGFVQDAVPAGLFAHRASFLRGELPASGVRTFTDWLHRAVGSSQSPHVVAAMYLFGGKVKQVPAEATAFVHRDADLLLAFRAQWGVSEPPDVVAANQAWVDGFFNAMQPYVEPQAYQNFPDPRLRVPGRSYYDGDLRRLMAVKRRYDPDDLFRPPQGVPEAR